jgi:dTDP-4-dehydrorhamnose reductase
MDESKILIVGANGQLGKALQVRYPSAKTVESSQLDISNGEAVNNFDWNGTGIILNAAGYTNVDGAETPDGRVAAWSVNAVGAANLARIAHKHDLTLVHISSDYVFDGTKVPHTETENFSPLSVYGESKAAGDIAVGLVPKHYVLRASWVIGDGKNFVRTMLGVGQKEIEPTVVNDQRGRLTFTSELVRAIDHLLGSKSAYGTYNVSNSGDVASWADVTRAIFHEAGFQLNVTDTSTAEYFAGKENIAPRPADSEFDLSKLQATGFESHDWHDDLSEYIKKELQV